MHKPSDLPTNHVLAKPIFAPKASDRVTNPPVGPTAPSLLTMSLTASLLIRCIFPHSKACTLDWLQVEFNFCLFVLVHCARWGHPFLNECVRRGRSAVQTGWYTGPFYVTLYKQSGKFTAVMHTFCANNVLSLGQWVRGWHEMMRCRPLTASLHYPTLHH